MRKVGIACYKQFLLFSQCFPQLYIFSASNVVFFGNGLNLSFSVYGIVSQMVLCGKWYCVANGIVLRMLDLHDNVAMF